MLCAVVRRQQTSFLPDLEQKSGDFHIVTSSVNPTRHWGTTETAARAVRFGDRDALAALFLGRKFRFRTYVPESFDWSKLSENVITLGGEESNEIAPRCSML